MWYQNICSASFSFATIHACDRQTDGLNYDSQDCPRICLRGNKMLAYITMIRLIQLLLLLFLLNVFNLQTLNLCVCMWQLINAGITSGTKGALDLWRQQSVSSLESATDELSPHDVTAAGVDSPVSVSFYHFLYR